MTQLSMADGASTSSASGLNRIKERITALSFAQKAIAIIGAVALLAGGAALYYFSNQERMSPVYSNLDPADASEIVEQLSADGVEYELTGGGTTVMVPESQVYEARLRAASEGLPGNTRGGYGLLDDMGVTASDFQQTVTYKRAIEGELASTVEALEAVKTASVSLSIPEETVFTDEAEEPTASVFISSAPGATFSDEQVYSISHIVSAAVDGLDPDNVAVVDSEGTLLAGIGSEGPGGASGAAAEYEERVQASVVSMLDTVVGRGNSTVTVNAAVSQQSSELLEETFEDSEAGPLTEITNTEEYLGGGGGAGGVLGPDNIAVPNGADGEGAYTAEQNELQNAVNKATQTTNIPAGALDRQTVSVAIDEEAAAGVDAELLTAMVTDAVGLDEERGDALSVSLVPFSAADADAAAEALAAAEAEAAEAAAAEAETTRNIIMAVAALVVLILIAIIIAILSKKRRKNDEGDFEDLGETFTSLPPSRNEGPAPSLLDTTDITDVLPAARGLEPVEPTPSAQHRADLNALATDDPAQLADHLRTLMDQEEVKL